MYIGKLSELTGVSRKAIRNYEKIGLIPAPSRNGTYRVYDQNHVFLISAIKRARSLGFKLSELVPLYSAKREMEQFPVEIARDTIDRKIEELKNQINQARYRERELHKLRRQLNEFNCSHSTQ